MIFQLFYDELNNGCAHTPFYWYLKSDILLDFEWLNLNRVDIGIYYDVYTANECDLYALVKFIYVGICNWVLLIVLTTFWIGPTRNDAWSSNQ